MLYHLTLAVVVFIFHGKLYLNTCSVELQAGGVHAMNSAILTKWHIALSTSSKMIYHHQGASLSKHALLI